MPLRCIVESELRSVPLTVRGTANGLISHLGQMVPTGTATAMMMVPSRVTGSHSESFGSPGSLEISQFLLFNKITKKTCGQWKPISLWTLDSLQVVITQQNLRITNAPQSAVNKHPRLQ
jgi:hypothetical protein